VSSAVENPLLEVVKHANLHYREEFRLWEVAHDTGNITKPSQSSVKKAGQEFGIGRLGVAIAVRPI